MSRTDAAEMTRQTLHRTNRQLQTLIAQEFERTREVDAEHIGIFLDDRVTALSEGVVTTFPE